MVAIGLVPELTAEAAKRAALGAGARVLKVYSYELTEDEIKEIEDSDVDIIYLLVEQMVEINNVFCTMQK